MTYVPPQITETNETHKSDCTWCSGLETLGGWTWGEALSVDHVPLNDGELHTLREALRPGPSNDTSGSNYIEVARAVEKRWPDLPPMPSWDNPKAPVRVNWSQWVKAIEGGACGSLAGNSVRVKNPNSPLHLTGDVNHSIYIDHRRADGKFLILNPMRPNSDTGDLIEEQDLHEFALTFGAGFIICQLVQKGEQHSSQIVQRKLDKTSASLSAATQKVSDLSAALKTTADARDAALLAQGKAEVAQKSAEDALGPCEAAAADLQARLDAANALIATQVTGLADLQTKNDQLTTDLWHADGALAIAKQTITDAEAALAAANETIASLTAQLTAANTSLGVYQRAIAFLRRFFGKLP